MPIDMTKLVFRITFMAVKSKGQITSQAKQRCSENLKFSKSSMLSFSIIVYSIIFQFTLPVAKLTNN